MMNIRILNKAVNAIYKATTKGNFKAAYKSLQRYSSSPAQERQILNAFNERAYKKLGAKSFDTTTNFTLYNCCQHELAKNGGIKGISKQLTESIQLDLSQMVEQGSQAALAKLPKSKLEWLKVILKDEWDKLKVPTDKLKRHLKSQFKLFKSTKNAKFKTLNPEYKPLLAKLEGKSGKEFIDTAYENTVKHLKLDGIAPKSLKINGSDGVMSIKGGYNYIDNTIEYSQGFLEKLPPKQQMNLIAHELKHCEQFSNILRTENITTNDYARAIAENSLKQALDKSSFDFSLKYAYKKALEQGKGEEFIAKQLDELTKSYVSKIETNFSEVLKLPKIKASSPEGIKAAQHFEALKKYEGIDLFGFGSENYRNNPLEVEAYAFGDNIEKIFNDFVS
jgi:hypothetical protein